MLYQPCSCLYFSFHSKNVSHFLFIYYQFLLIKIIYFLKFKNVINYFYNCFYFLIKQNCLLYCYVIYFQEKFYFYLKCDISRSLKFTKVTGDPRLERAKWKISTFVDAESKCRSLGWHLRMPSPSFPFYDHRGQQPFPIYIQHINLIMLFRFESENGTKNNILQRFYFSSNYFIRLQHSIDSKSSQLSCESFTNRYFMFSMTFKIISLVTLFNNSVHIVFNLFLTFFSKTPHFHFADLNKEVEENWNWNWFDCFSEILKIEYKIKKTSIFAI